MAPLNLNNSKEDLALQILQHELKHGQNYIEPDICKHFIQNNFMFPLRKSALTLGLLNEPEVVKALPYHVHLASLGVGGFTIEQPGVVEVGIAMNNKHTYIGASVDGIMVIKGVFNSDSPRVKKRVVLEIKSKVSDQTSIDTEKYKTNQKIKTFTYIRVKYRNLKDDCTSLHKHIPDPDHVAQVWCLTL